MKVLETETSVIKKEKILKDDLISYQESVNDKIVDQYWVTKNPKKTHPYCTFNNEHLRFYYFGENAFQEIEFAINVNITNKKIDKVYPKPKIVNINKFNNYDKLFANWLNQDGFVYSITDKIPLSFWTYQDYISGIRNDRYDLEKALNYLNHLKKHVIRNIKLIDIPYYNADDETTNAIEFEYRLPRSMLEKFKNLKSKKRFVTDICLLRDCGLLSEIDSCLKENR